MWFSVVCFGHLLIHLVARLFNLNGTTTCFLESSKRCLPAQALQRFTSQMSQCKEGPGVSQKSHCTTYSRLYSGSMVNAESVKEFFLKFENLLSTVKQKIKMTQKQFVKLKETQKRIRGRRGSEGQSHFFKNISECKAGVYSVEYPFFHREY